MRITPEMVLAANPCSDYPDDRIRELCPPEGLTPTEVAALPIPATDRHWVLVYAAGASDRVLRLHACWCARRALALVPTPDPSSIAGVKVAARFACGRATGGELDAARAAAGVAAWAAAMDAAVNDLARRLERSGS